MGMGRGMGMGMGMQGKSLGALFGDQVAIANIGMPHTGLPQATVTGVLVPS